MPEKVRRIKKKKRTSTRWKKWVFFVLLAVLVVFVVRALPQKQKEAPRTPTIHDKQAVAAICTQVGCGAVNKEGVVFEHISRPSGNLLFRIDLPNRTEPVALAESPIPPERIAELLFLRQQLKQEEQAHLLTASALTSTETDFDIETQEGWVLKVTTQNNANATITVLRRTLNELGEQESNLDYIDLRIPNRVYYAFKE